MFKKNMTDGIQSYSVLAGKCLEGRQRNKVLIKITADTLFFAIVFADLVNMCFILIVLFQTRDTAAHEIYILYFFVCAERDISQCCVESLHSMFS